MSNRKIVSARFSARFMQKGKQGDKGDTGLSGPAINPAGLWVAGRIYYNNDEWIDVVLVKSSSGVITKYKLRKYVDGVRQTALASDTLPSSDSTHWERASNIDFLATSAIIADAGYIDVLGAGSMFVGEQDRDADLQNGWLMTAGAIKHRGTGLELTKEGYINDPDGLHFRVGGKSLATNIPEWAGLANSSPFTWNTTTMDYVASNVGSIAPKGSAIFRMKNTGSSSISIIAQFGSSNMIKLKPNTTYTFSVWIAASAARSLYMYVQLHTAQATSSTHTSVGGVKGLKTTEQQFDFTFTTDEEHLYLNFWMGTVTSRLAAGAYILVTGLSLIEGSVAPTAWQAPGETLTSHIEEGLLSAGIDIGRKQINLYAEMLNCYNLQGKRTAYLDAMGNFNIAGVLNNMIATLAPANYASYGCYYENNNDLYLNPLVCPMYLKCNVNQSALQIWLPSYKTGDAALPIKTRTTDEEGVDVYTRYSLDELRQMVGKRIIIIPTNVEGTGSPSIKCDTMFYRYRKYGGTRGGLELIGNTGAAVEEWLQPETLIAFYRNDQTRVLRAECKAGLYSSRECIYWEVDEVGAAL